MESSQWFYLKTGQQRGPVDTGDLASLIHSGVLPPDTLVFTSTQADWIPANTTGMFPIKAATLRTNRHTSRKVNITLIILLLLMLCGGLLMVQQKQGITNPNNERATLKEPRRQELDKIQFDVAKPSSRENGAKQVEFGEQNGTGNRQIKRRLDSDNSSSANDNETLQNQLFILQNQYASLEAERRATEKREQRYKSNIAAAESNAASARKNEARNDDQLAKVNIARLQLEQRLEESRQHNAKLHRQIKKIESRSQPNKQTDVELTEANNMRRQLEKQLAKANQLNTNLHQHLEKINNQQDTRNNTMLAAQLRKATEELIAAQQKISILERQLRSPTSERNQPQQTPAAPVTSVGKISNVNINLKLAAINRGSGNGIKNGDTFRIISRTTGAFLGRITIKRTQPTIAVGTLDGQGIEHLKASDLLFR